MSRSMGASTTNSGKTWVGCTSICQHFWQWPKINQGYFAPTYPQIRDIFYPTMDEVAATMGLAGEGEPGRTTRCMSTRGASTVARQSVARWRSPKPLWASRLATG
ncbi:terminase large subunit domain-containing protein [Cupriavidus basilensis]